MEQEQDGKQETQTNQSTDKRLPVRVEQIRDRPDRIPPIVAYFPTRYDPLEVDEETGEKVYETPKITIFNHKDDREKMTVLVSPPVGKVEFVGSSFSGEAAATPTTSYALGVLNREKQTMRILPVACNKIIRLDPRVLSQGTLDEEAALRLDEDKKKRALNVRDNPDTHKFLKVEPSKPDTNAGALTHKIPPYDASATTPREAYPLDKIIEEDELEFLQDIYRLLQQESVAADDSYPVFVRNRLHKLRDIEVESEKQMLSAALSLLTHLVKFKDLFSKEGRNSARGHKIPGFIRIKCFNLFKHWVTMTDDLTIDQTNLLISYVLVLALHVDNFKTDPEDIAQDLRMSTLDLRKHFASLGCKFSWDKSVVVVTLPTPLNFSIKSKTPKRRGKKTYKGKG